MESDIFTQAQPSPVADPEPPMTKASYVTPKKNSKILYLVAGLATILVSLALGIVFMSKNSATSKTADSTTESSTKDTSKDLASSTYQNSLYFYELTLPDKWVEIKHSPLSSSTALFNAADLAILEVSAEKNTLTLEDNISAIDTKFKDTIKSTKTTQVKVGQYDGYERTESWPIDGRQGIATYVKVQDMFYIFTLSPSSGKNSVVSDTTIRSYHSLLESFHLTDTSLLGKDLKSYQSEKVAGLAFNAFSLKYPQSWVLSEKKGTSNLEISIYRNNYELTISQKAVGGAVCLFSDSPSFEGSSGDLRSKQFAEFSTDSGLILRRYFNVNSGDKSSMFFCEKQHDGPYFQTPLTIGGLAYYVPAKYDPDIIKEMDDIIKSIVPVDPNASQTGL